MKLKTDKIPVLVISGTVGVGKSSVASEISDILISRGISHGVIDLDYLRHAFPRPPDDPFHTALGYKNLSQIAKNYRDANVTRLIIPNVVEEKTDIDKIRNAIPGADILVVRLRGKLDTIQERLKKREIGTSLRWHLHRAEELSEILEKTKTEDFIVDIDNKSINEIAQEVLSKSHYLL